MASVAVPPPHASKPSDGSKAVGGKVELKTVSGNDGVTRSNSRKESETKEVTPSSVASHRSFRKRYRESGLQTKGGLKRYRPLPYVISYKIESKITKWDDNTFAGTNSDEELKQIKFDHNNAANEFDDQGVEPVVFKDIKEADKAAREVFLKILYELVDKKYSDEEALAESTESKVLKPHDVVTKMGLHGIQYFHKVECEIDCYSTNNQNIAATTIIVQAQPVTCKYLRNW